MRLTRPVWMRKMIVMGFWLLLWHFASVYTNNSILMVGPLDTWEALINQANTARFWITIIHSFCKIFSGFLAAFLMGISLGSVSFCFPPLRELLEPVLLLMKSIPVASFVILALIWIGSKNLSVFISFTVVFPVIYINTLSGLLSTDKKLLEMAQVFRITAWKKIRYIFIPALLPYLISGCKTALSMGWKSGIAAEVIGVPDRSIGEQLYMAKIYLSTADLFAWTFVIIIISAVMERLFLALLNKIS